MTKALNIHCSCGQTQLEVIGKPIASVECCCTSCGEAGKRMQQLHNAPITLTEYDATPFVMYRKDRVSFLAGADSLKSFRLTPEASTERVVATCCNTPVYLSVKGGHWLSLYGMLWPEGSLPPAEIRTMTSDLPDGAVLPDDILNAKKHSLGFFAKLFGAWAGMGFQNPKIEVEGTLDA